MKKILFLLALVIFLACNKNQTAITEERIVCQNTPPLFYLIIAKNEIKKNIFEVEAKDFKPSEKEAILYKLVGNEKIKMQNLGVDNENIYILNKKKEVKTFFTGNLETFYVEYKGVTDTLQIKGNYYENAKCGDTSVLVELYFNGKKADNNDMGGIINIDNFNTPDK